MIELLGAVIGTSMFYGLVCWILRVKHSKRFIVAGIITWLLCATVYGLTNMEYFYTRFLTGLFMYFIGAVVWTGLAIYFDKTNKNIKWILRYIPIGALVGAVALFILSFLIYKATHEVKRTRINDEIMLVVTGVRSLMGEYNDYSGLTNDWFFRVLDISDKNPYDGVYRVDAYESDPRFFIVSITNVPPTDCKYLIEHEWMDSVLYKLNSAEYTGALAIPSDCSGQNNVVQIMFD